MTLIRQIVERAVKDETFRTRLIKDAKATIEKEFGRTFPEGITIQVHQDSPTVLNLVLPGPLDLATKRSLSREELEQVAGGQRAVNLTTLKRCTGQWC